VINTGNVTCYLTQNTSMRFRENTDRIFEDKLQKRRTEHFTEKHSRNRKHRPQAWKRQTEARMYWREREHCGWMV